MKEAVKTLLETVQKLKSQVEENAGKISDLEISNEQANEEIETINVDLGTFVKYLSDEERAELKIDNNDFGSPKAATTRKIPKTKGGEMTPAETQAIALEILTKHNVPMKMNNLFLKYEKEAGDRALGYTKFTVKLRSQFSRGELVKMVGKEGEPSRENMVGLPKE